MFGTWGGAARRAAERERRRPPSGGGGAGLRARAVGFTLIEVILVVVILATIAGGLVVALGGAEERAHSELTSRQLNEVAQALLRFRADTGYLPGEPQGPFRFGLWPDPAGGDAGGDITANELPAWVAAQGYDPQAWLASPANLWLLLTPASPLPPDHPVTRRGWKGPYLRAAGDGFVSVGNGFQTTGGLSAGSPTTGTPVVVPAAPDGQRFARDPGAGGYMDWWTEPPPTQAPSDPAGCPFLILWRDVPETADLTDRDVELRSFGPDGEYDTGDDVRSLLTRWSPRP